MSPQTSLVVCLFLKLSLPTTVYLCPIRPCHNFKSVSIVWVLPNKLWTFVNTPYTTLHLHLCTGIHLSHAFIVLSHSPHQDHVLAFMALSDWSTWTPPLTFTLLMYMFHSTHFSYVQFFFFSVYTVNLSLLCNHCLSPFFVLESCKFPFFISFCERHLVFSYFFFVLVVPLMCVS